MLQKPGLDIWLQCAVFPGMLILKLSKVDPMLFPLEGPSVATLTWELGAEGREPPVCEPVSWGPLPLGSFSARPRPGCPGPSLPVRRLMQVLGSSTVCPLAGAWSCVLSLRSLWIFGILGSFEKSGLLGSVFWGCPRAIFLDGKLEWTVILDEAELRGNACVLEPLSLGLLFCFKVGLLSFERFPA